MRKFSRNIVILLCVMLMLAILPASILADVEENASEGILPDSVNAAVSHEDELADSGVKVFVATVTGSAGQTVTVPVSIENNTGLAGFTFQVSCDEGLSLVDMNKGSLLMKSKGGALTKNLANGQVNWTDIYNLYEDGELLILTVQISEDAAYGDYGIYVALKEGKATNLVSERGVALNAEFLSGGITVGHNHTYSVESITPPTCTEQGYTVYVCDCEHSYTGDYVEALGHDIITHEAKTPTCIDAGWDAYETCSRCDYTTFAEKTALGHAYQAVTTAPTCTDAGYTTYTCVNGCQDSYQADIVQPLGHDVIDHEAKEANCTEAGWDAYEACSRCDYTTISEKPALGHDITAHAAKVPTCTESGWDAYETCSRCDYTTYAEKPATGHAYKAVVTAPTCTDAGFTTYTCVNGCQDSYRADEVEALGHDIVAHEAKEPTCTEVGWDAYEACSRCDYTTFVGKPALGHDTQAHAGKEPTCTEAGWYDYVTCSRCDYTTYTERKPLEHTFEDGVCTGCGAEDPNCPGGDACPARANNYTDILPTDHWAHMGVDYCILHGYMRGTAPGIFTPKGTLSRAEFVTILYRVAGEPNAAVATYKATFTDVPNNTWYTDAIEWAAAEGYVKGIGGGRFDPEGKITREQIVTILYRYSGEPEVEGDLSDFPDCESVSDFAVDAMIWATNEGIIKGAVTNGVTRLAPLENATREQIAVIIMRILKGEILPHTAGLAKN